MYYICYAFKNHNVKHQLCSQIKIKYNNKNNESIMLSLANDICELLTTSSQENINADYNDINFIINQASLKLNDEIKLINSNVVESFFNLEFIAIHNSLDYQSSIILESMAPSFDSLNTSVLFRNFIQGCAEQAVVIRTKSINDLLSTASLFNTFKTNQQVLNDFSIKYKNQAKITNISIF